MHEVVFAKTILNELESIREKDKEIAEIVLELGELVGIEADHLLEGLQSISNYNYKIVIKGSFIRCNCGYEGSAEIVERLHDQVIWKCPWCDNPIETIEVVDGDKIKIAKIKYK
jgi:Zn finger protein HypA/HybF involved in hydrogenase expression